MLYRKGQGGRPRGAKNRFPRASPKRDIQAALDALSRGVGGADTHLQRIQELVQSKDEHVAVKALALVLAYRFGQPKATWAVTGEGGGPVHIHHHFAALP